MKPVCLKIKAARAKPPRGVMGLFDTGSDDGLIRRQASNGLTTVTLPDPVRVLGIGGGGAHARELAIFEVRVLGAWCRYAALVIPDGAVDVDLLIGEDFMIRYGLRLDPRRNRVEIANLHQFRRMTRRGIFIPSPRGMR